MKHSLQHILTCIFMYGMAVLFWACTKTTNNSDVEVWKEPQEKPGRNLTTAYTVVDSISMLKESDRAILPFNGRFFSSVSWNDKLGKNTLVLSEKGDYHDGNGRKEIFAYHYIKGDTANELLWQMNDFVDGGGCDLSIELIHFFPYISDIDSNGIAETAIFYSLDNRCDASSFPAKLIVHEGAKKFTIRGIRHQFLGPPEKVLNGYRAKNDLPPLKFKDLDTVKSTWNSSIVSFYSHQWDAFISTENKLEGALPDSLFTSIH